MTGKITSICILVVGLIFVVNSAYGQGTAYSKDDLPLAELLYENRDGKLAFQVFSELAKTGDAEAMAWLGRCYMNGVGVNRDGDRAFLWFSKAAELGESWGINGMGVCFNYGIGTQKNLQRAFECYKKASEMNHPLAALNLAKTLSSQEEGFFNLEQADTMFKKAIELKNPDAESAYGAFLFNQGKFGEAIPHLLAARDNPDAKRMLIQCYENGWGTPIDIRKAVELADDYALTTPSDARFGADVLFDAAVEESFFNGKTDWFVNYVKRAANYGNREARVFYEVILEEQNDLEGALHYATLSADEGQSGANFEVGKLAAKLKKFDIALKYLTMASLETSTERDAVDYLVSIYAYELGQKSKSRHWAQRGVELGSAYCRNELADDTLLVRTPENIARAYRLIYASHIDDNTSASDWLKNNIKYDYETLRELADKGNVDALVSLGLLGALNEKDHPNIAVGLELLAKAADLKCGEACRWLGNIHYNGGVVDKDLRKAFEWYKKGAELGDVNCARSVVSMLYNVEEFGDVPFEECKKWCDISLQFDDSCAFICGQIYEYKGQDIETATRLYESAAKNNDARAMIVLHDMYWDKDRDLSISYLLDAIDLNDVVAMYRCGLINRFYFNQPRKAFIAFVKAYAFGDHIDAPYQLACCLLQGIGCAVNTNVALEMAEEAYQNGESQSCSLLGSLYMEGAIVPKNEAKAKQYYEEGVKRGDRESRKALGLSVEEQ